MLMSILITVATPPLCVHMFPRLFRQFFTMRTTDNFPDFVTATNPMAGTLGLLLIAGFRMVNHVHQSNLTRSNGTFAEYAQFNANPYTLMGNQVTFAQPTSTKVEVK
jgi:hypothetical protein